MPKKIWKTNTFSPFKRGFCLAILSAEWIGFFFCFFWRGGCLGSSEIFKVPLRDVQEVHIHDGSSGYGAEGKVGGRTATSAERKNVG